jgi:hypothetical protein
MAQQPLVDKDLLTGQASRSHSDTPHSVGPLWTGDQHDTEIATWQHTTLSRDRHPCSRAGFKPTIPESEWSKTQALESAATWIGRIVISLSLLHRIKYVHLSLHYLSSKLLPRISGCATGCAAESFEQLDVLPSPLCSSNLFCDYESQVHVKVTQVTGTCLICLELFECLSNRRTCCIKQRARERERERSSVVSAHIINYDSSSSTCCFRMYHRHSHSNNMVEAIEPLSDETACKQKLVLLWPAERLIISSWLVLQ